MKIKFLLTIVLLALLVSAFAPPPPDDGLCYMQKEDLSGNLYTFVVDCDPALPKIGNRMQRLRDWICIGENNCFFAQEGKG